MLPPELERSPALTTVLFAVYLTVLNDDAFSDLFRFGFSGSSRTKRQKNVLRTKDLIRSILDDLLKLDLICNIFDLNEALLVLEASRYIKCSAGVISFEQTSDLGTELGRYLEIDEDILNKISDET